MEEVPLIQEVQPADGATPVDASKVEGDLKIDEISASPGDTEKSIDASAEVDVE